MYRAIVDKYDDSRSRAIFSGDRNSTRGTKHYSAMAFNIRALLPFAIKYIPVLDIAVFSLLVMYYGRLHSDARLIHIARSGYTAAISQFRQNLHTAIPGAARATYVARFCTSVALCCFEQLDEIATSDLATRRTWTELFGFCSRVDQT